MTAQLSREELQQIADTDHVQCGDAAAMARMLLAGMDSAPVAEVVSKFGDPEAFGERELKIRVDIQKMSYGTKFYAAPPAPVAVPDDVFNAAYDQYLNGVVCGDNNKQAALSFLNACRAAMQAEPVTAAYKLRDAVETIRNSGIEIDTAKIFAERNALNTPDCWCRTCRPITLTDMRFVVCPECGNKRCPHANDHRHACTGSNEPGQEGSAYPAAPEQEV